MEFTIRLAEILGFDPSQRKGVIKDICDHTGLERHLVADLLRGRTRSINMHVLRRLCDYLIERKGVDADDLPGILFGRRANEFWQTLACHRSVEMVFGIRKASAEPEDRFVSAADILLQADLLHGISSAGQTPPSEDNTRRRSRNKPAGAKSNKASSQASPKTAGSLLPRRLVHEQLFVRSPEENDTSSRLLEDARHIYRGFEKRDGEKTLICLGSIKSNPVIELVLAHTFGARPFVSQDEIGKVSDRACPIFFRYRKHDVKPPSCCGGSKLARSRRTREPGIYYETKSGQWVCCPSTPKEGAALVFYAYYPQRGRSEAVIGGFSGRDTWYVAQVLSDYARDFWPPSYSTSDLEVGIFILRFKYKRTKREGEGSETPRQERPASVELISLPAETLARRLT